MTIEPHIKSKHVLAGVYGASASCVAFLLLLICTALVPVAPDDDTSIRSAATLVEFIPLMWLVLFLYFFAISFKTVNRLRFALIFQSLWIFLVSGLPAYVAFSHGGWSAALPVLTIMFLIFTMVIGIGSWCSTLAK